MVELKNQENEFPIKSEDDQYDNEFVITEDEKEDTEKDLPPYYEEQTNHVGLPKRWHTAFAKWEPSRP